MSASAPVSVRPSATLSAVLSVQACHGLYQQQHRLRGRRCLQKQKPKQSSVRRTAAIFSSLSVSSIKCADARLRPEKSNCGSGRLTPPRELRSRGCLSGLFPSGMFPEKQADSKLNKPAREQFAVLPRTGNKKRFLCGTVTRTGADGFCRSAFNPAESLPPQRKRQGARCYKQARYSPSGLRPP